MYTLQWWMWTRNCDGCNWQAVEKLQQKWSERQFFLHRSTCVWGVGFQYCVCVSVEFDEMQSRFSSDWGQEATLWVFMKKCQWHQYSLLHSKPDGRHCSSCEKKWKTGLLCLNNVCERRPPCPFSSASRNASCFYQMTWHANFTQNQQWRCTTH